MENVPELSDFCGPDIINIFTDGSAINYKGSYKSSFGFVVIKGNDIIEKEYRMCNGTSNNAEIKGIRKALDLCYKYKDQYRRINIISDSNISIMGLKQYIYNWKVSKTGKLYTGTKKEVASQNVFIEARQMLDILEASPCIISIYHISSHVNTSNYNELLDTANTFKKLNNLTGKIDLNVIRYLCDWNNHVDIGVKSHLRRNYKVDKNIYIDPLLFMPKIEMSNWNFNNIL